MLIVEIKDGDMGTDGDRGNAESAPERGNREMSKSDGPSVPAAPLNVETDEFNSATSQEVTVTERMLENMRKLDDANRVASPEEAQLIIASLNRSEVKS